MEEREGEGEGVGVGCLARCFRGIWDMSEHLVSFAASERVEGGDKRSEGEAECGKTRGREE